MEKKGSTAMNVDDGSCGMAVRVFYGSAGEHHESKGLGAVEAVGASDEQPDLGVEAFVRPLDSPRSMAGSIPARCLRMVPAALTNSGIRQR